MSTSFFSCFVAFVFFGFSTQPATAQNLSTVSCCALDKSTLVSISQNTPQEIASCSHRLKEKCQPCPEATCRLDDLCICADDFLSSTQRPTQCNNAFGATWPTSIGKEDRDSRSCSPNVKPPPESTTSCCALNQTELQALRGFSADCPSSRFDFQLAQKCASCPTGTCRMGQECICPDAFLDRSSLHDDCGASFDASWPQSIPKEDRAYRSCRGVSPPRSTGLSCCSLKDTQLADMIGTSDRCPSTFSARLSDECGTCPSGMCRFERSCYCPSHFLTSAILADRCERTFGVAWPESIGKPDPDISGCGSDTSTPPTKNEQGTDNPPSSGSTPTSQGDTSSLETQAPATASESNSEPRLTTLEIVGVVAGVVSAIVTVFVAAIGLMRRRKNGNHEEPTLDELIA